MMATYYRWNRYGKNSYIPSDVLYDFVMDRGSIVKIFNSKPPFANSAKGYVYDVSNPSATYEYGDVKTEIDVTNKYFVFTSGNTSSNIGYADGSKAKVVLTNSTNMLLISSKGLAAPTGYRAKNEPTGPFDYVYSNNSSAYPNDAVDDYRYYENRTTIVSPTAPSDLMYPNPITTPTVTVSWRASSSNVPAYRVNKYEVSYSVNGGAWKGAGTPSGTSLEVTVPTEATSIQFRVRAQDSNGQWSTTTTGVVSTILIAPTISVPSQSMQGQSIPVSWTAVDGATGYTLQRKANTDADWVEVYTGQDLEFTEEVGTWSTVQYRVQATFSSGPGGWGTSKVVPVVSASALVISGQDGDLGTLTADVPYTVSTDTGKPITVERKVNGQVVASIEASSNFAYDIPIYDLPTGAGTITLTCSVTPEGQAPVQAERKWTYYKAPILFPQTGSTAQITKEGKNIYPLTIAEAVRTPQYMGGSLDKTLELLEEILNTAVISIGTYVGTGTSGQSAPNRLRFMSPPTVVTVYGEGRVLSISNAEPTGGQADAYIQGNEAIWYNISADKQLNESGKTYTYFAAGKRV